jgi:superfamily II DNA or RNA helicase
MKDLQLIYYQKVPGFPARWWRYRFDPEAVAVEAGIADPITKLQIRHDQDRTGVYEVVSSSFLQQEHDGVCHYYSKRTGRLRRPKPGPPLQLAAGGPLCTESLTGGVVLPHQVAGAEFLLNAGRGMLLWVAGIGKTVTAAVMISELYRLGELEPGSRHPVLWLTIPQRLTETVCALKALLPSLKVAAGGPTPADGVDITVLSMHALPRRGSYMHTPFHLVVIDELRSVARNTSATNSAAALSRRTARVVGLTEAPWRTHPGELFSMLTAIGLPPRIGFHEKFIDSRPGYRNRFGWQPSKPLGPKAGTAAALAAALRPFTHVCAARDIPAMPALRSHVEWLPLSGGELCDYRDAESVARRDPSKAARYFDAACAPTGDPSLAEPFGPASKVQHAAQLICGLAPTEKLIVFSEHSAQADQVTRALGGRVAYVRIDTKAKPAKIRSCVKAFGANPSIRLLLTTSASDLGCDGLQSASVIIACGTTTSRTLEAQQLGQAYRLGGPHLEIQYIQLLTDTPHERAKHEQGERAETHAELLRLLATES